MAKGLLREKRLKGASRAALAFIKARWLDLLQASIVPFGAFIALMILQLQMLMQLFTSLKPLASNQPPPREFLAAFFGMMGFNFLSALLVVFLFALLFVQIIRMQREEDAAFLITDKAGLVAALMVCLYAIGIYFLSYFALLALFAAGAILVAILGGIVYAVLGESRLLTGIIGFLAFTGVLGLQVSMIWVLFRFLAGLPAVALGRSPDFFREMWPLTKGESWGLPLRAIAASLLIFVPVMMANAVIVLPRLMSFVEKAPARNADPDPAVVQQIAMELMTALWPVYFLMILAYLPFVWFMSLLFGETYRRFSTQ